VPNVVARFLGVITNRQAETNEQASLSFLHPMASDLIESAQETAAPSIIINPRKRSPSWGSQPLEPVPAIGVRGHHKSSLSNCSDVREIYGECLATHNSDQLCKTAVSYFSVCSSFGRE
jgi:hypothetical protein